MQSVKNSSIAKSFLVFEIVASGSCLITGLALYFLSQQATVGLILSGTGVLFFITAPPTGLMLKKYLSFEKQNKAKAVLVEQSSVEQSLVLHEERPDSNWVRPDYNFCLPNEILAEIFKHLAKINIYTFHQVKFVCSIWNNTRDEAINQIIKEWPGRNVQYFKKELKRAADDINLIYQAQVSIQKCQAFLEKLNSIEQISAIDQLNLPLIGMHYHRGTDTLVIVMAEVLFVKKFSNGSLLSISSDHMAKDRNETTGLTIDELNSPSLSSDVGYKFCTLSLPPHLGDSFAVGFVARGTHSRNCFAVLSFVSSKIQYVEADDILLSGDCVLASKEITGEISSQYSQITLFSEGKVYQDIIKSHTFKTKSYNSFHFHQERLWLFGRSDTNRLVEMELVQYQKLTLNEKGNLIAHADKQFFCKSNISVSNENALFFIEEGGLKKYDVETGTLRESKTNEANIDVFFIGNELYTLTEKGLILNWDQKRLTSKPVKDIVISKSKITGYAKTIFQSKLKSG